MAYEDYSDEDINPEESKKELENLTKKFLGDSDENPVQPQQKDLPRIISMGEKVSNFFSRAGSIGKKMISANLKTHQTKNYSRVGRAGNPYQKFVYIRNKATGKLMTRRINPKWAAYMGYSSSDFDLAGRLVGGRSGQRRTRGFANPKSRFQKGSQNLLKTILPIDQDTIELAQLQRKKAIAQSKINIASASMSAIANKFNERLIGEENMYRQIQQRRDYNTCPPDWIKRRLQLQKQHIQNTAEHSRANNILKANMLNPKDLHEFTYVDIADNSILKPIPGNNILEQRPDSLNLLSTGRPSILNAKNIFLVSDGGGQ